MATTDVTANNHEMVIGHSEEATGTRLSILAEPYDILGLKLGYLRGLIATITADDCSSFHCLTPNLQIDALWLVSSLINEAYASYDVLEKEA